MSRTLLLLAFAVPAGTVGGLSGQAAAPPRQHVAGFAPQPPQVDGRLDEAAWHGAAWSEPFVDIAGDQRAPPRWRTRVRLAWDSTALYIAAALEEPHLWATLTERDAVIYHDNDFEWFIDPDGDAERYFELEINALGTVWDLFLPRPYRHGGRAVDAWDIVGLQAAVALDGTLNDPSDVDRGWTVEMAVPWQAFADSGRTSVPPAPGDRWRINFSRVQWDLDVVEGRYLKRRGTDGRPLPEHNWVWSPQGEVNMHIPERWGTVIFAARAATEAP